MIDRFVERYLTKNGITEISDAELFSIIEQFVQKVPKTVLEAQFIIMESKDLDNQLNRFGELSDEIDKLNATIEKLKKEFKDIEEEIRPLIETAEGLASRHLETSKYIITIKKKGYTKTNPKYKDAFSLALSKVNNKTRTILNESLAASTTVSKVASKIGVQQKEGIVQEGLFNAIGKKFKSVFNKLLRKLKGLDKDVALIQKLSRL